MELTSGKTKFYLASHALIKRDGKYLVTKRSAMETYAPLKWDLPGGTVNPGETLPEALKREVKEEVNLKISGEKLLFIFSNLESLPETQVFQTVFLADYAGGELSLIPKQHSEHQWLDKSEIKALDSISFLKALTESESFNQL
jgi:ADP-ribose pyrophosphatase YjhB (NUDIX family)